MAIVINSRNFVFDHSLFNNRLFVMDMQITNKPSLDINDTLLMLPILFGSRSSSQVIYETKTTEGKIEYTKRLFSKRFHVALAQTADGDMIFKIFLNFDELDSSLAELEGGFKKELTFTPTVFDHAINDSEEIQLQWVVSDINNFELRYKLTSASNYNVIQININDFPVIDPGMEDQKNIAENCFLFDGKMHFNQYQSIDAMQQTEGDNQIMDLFFEINRFLVFYNDKCFDTHASIPARDELYKNANYQLPLDNIKSYYTFSSGLDNWYNDVYDSEFGVEIRDNQYNTYAFSATKGLAFDPHKVRFSLPFTLTEKPNTALYDKNISFWIRIDYDVINWLIEKRNEKQFNSLEEYQQNYVTNLFANPDITEEVPEVIYKFPDIVLFEMFPQGSNDSHIVCYYDHLTSKIVLRNLNGDTVLYDYVLGEWLLVNFTLWGQKNSDDEHADANGYVRHLRVSITGYYDADAKFDTNILFINGDENLFQDAGNPPPPPPPSLSTENTKMQTLQGYCDPSGNTIYFGGLKNEKDFMSITEAPEVFPLHTGKILNLSDVLVIDDANLYGGYNSIFANEFDNMIVNNLDGRAYNITTLAALFRGQISAGREKILNYLQHKKQGRLD